MWGSVMARQRNKCGRLRRGEDRLIAGLERVGLRVPGRLDVGVVVRPEMLGETGELKRLAPGSVEVWPLVLLLLLRSLCSRIGIGERDLEAIVTEEQSSVGESQRSDRSQAKSLLS
jgi:hypothetical protein